MTKRGFEFPEPSSQAEACFVYLIKRSDGTIKVGVSRNVAKRRSTLANASPDTLSILKTIETDEVLAFHIESGVKALLRQFRTRGEWFKCSDTLALLALRAAEHGELECRSRMATEIKRQNLRILDAETVAALTLPEGKQDIVFFDQDLPASAFDSATVPTVGCSDPGSSNIAPPTATKGG